jgi:hypothetical protein
MAIALLHALIVFYSFFRILPQISVNDLWHGNRDLYVDSSLTLTIAAYSLAILPCTRINFADQDSPHAREIPHARRTNPFTAASLARGEYRHFAQLLGNCSQRHRLSAFVATHVPPIDLPDYVLFRGINRQSNGLALFITDIGP